MAAFFFQDESVRMWNVLTGTQLLIFAGAEGHRNDAISCDFHPLIDGFIVSGGADNSVRVGKTAGSTTRYSTAVLLPSGFFLLSSSSSLGFGLASAGADLVL